MEKFCKFLRSMFAVFMAAILLFSMPLPTNAASATTYRPIVTNKHDDLNPGERAKTKFTLPAKAKVKITFLGLDLDTYYGTYGNYKMTIKNANGDIVYTKTAFSGYDDKKHITPELPKGDYTFILQPADKDYDLQYCYSLSYTVTAKAPVKKVKLNATTLKLNCGNKKTLKATLQPSYLTNEIVWSSSNNKIATVNKKGLVTAKSLGVAKITAKSGGKKATCKVIVNTKPVTVVKKRSLNVASYIKNIPNYKRAVWKSSNTGIATVDKTGKIIGKSFGKCDIYCTISGTKYTFKTSVKAAVSIGFDYLEDDDIYNDVCLKFINNTNLDVTYLTLQIYQYDNRGVRLASPYDYYYVNETIPANSSEYYEFWVNDNTKKVKYAITKVWFSNGTTWTP